jgi:hypothetical protein
MGDLADQIINPMLLAGQHGKWEQAFGKKLDIVITIRDRVVDAASSTFGVRLERPNRANRLPAGLKCTVRFLRQ